VIVLHASVFALAGIGIGVTVALMMLREAGDGHVRIGGGIGLERP
jgi:hypothetical protein